MVAHTRRGFRGVVEPASGRWLWQELRGTFPQAYGASLMPDHAHMGDVDDDVDAFARVLERHGRRFGARWDVAPPQPCNTRAILARALRHEILNPVREGLVSDPWCWPLSTLRDLGGAVADPWTPLPRIARLLGRRESTVIPLLSSDLGVEPAAPICADSIIVIDLPGITAAVASALRTRPDDVRRRGPARTLFVHLAYDCGSPRVGDVAAWCDATPRTIQNIRRGPIPRGLAAARLCLADPRLRIHDVDLVPRGRLRKVG